MNTVTVTFTQDDLNNITALMDMAVKASGLQGARAALVVMAKLEAAIQLANAAPAPAAPTE